MRNFWTTLATLFMIAVPCWYFGVLTELASRNGGLGQMETRGWINFTLFGLLLVYGILRLFGFKFPWRIKVVSKTDENPIRRATRL